MIGAFLFLDNAPDDHYSNAHYAGVMVIESVGRYSKKQSAEKRLLKKNDMKGWYDGGKYFRCE